MKRNMELIRLLLLRSEGDEQAEGDCSKFSVEERAYHVQLLIDAGLVEGIVRRGAHGEFTGAIVQRLTWTGHDFIDSIRDAQLWNKAKAQVLKSGASWTFDILKEWVKHELGQNLGIP